MDPLENIAARLSGWIWCTNLMLWQLCTHTCCIIALLLLYNNIVAIIIIIIYIRVFSNLYAMSLLVDNVVTIVLWSTIFWITLIIHLYTEVKRIVQAVYLNNFKFIEILILRFDEAGLIVFSINMVQPSQCLKQYPHLALSRSGR